jgi:diguanylate cyclase (GGDEF)-like protein
MPLVLVQGADGHEEIWHRRGLAGYLAAAALLVISARVTGGLDGRTVATLVTAVAVVALVAVVLLATRRLTERWSLLLWPVATIATLVAHCQADPASGALLIGLIPMAFLHIGLSQPPGRGLWLLLPAAVAWWTVLDLDLGAAAIRLPLAVLIWAASSELPARLVLQLREKNAALEQLATTDSLTGLLNRTRLGAHLERAGVDGSVALIDLDQFKRYNDEHGHVAGDGVLVDFAAFLRGGVRSQDAVFRYGGEEFLVVLTDTTPDDAAVVIARIRQGWSGRDSGLTFSAGITSSGLNAVADADTLLYRAKAEGRDRVVLDSGGTDPVAA